MKFTRTARAAAATILAAGALAAGTGGTAAAAPHHALQAYGVMGDDIWTTSDNQACSGTINVYNEVDEARPGNLRVWLTPSPSLTGEHCATSVKIGIMNGIFPFSHEWWVRVTGRTYIDVLSGTGVSMMSATTHLPSKGISHYIWTP